MLKVGMVGWRGMVGSVLMERMRAENDFALIEPVFFTTSNIGGNAPKEAGGAALKDAKDIAAGFVELTAKSRKVDRFPGAARGVCSRIEVDHELAAFEVAE